MYVRDLSGNEYAAMGTTTTNDEINGNINLSIVIENNKVNSAFIDKLAEFWELVAEDDELYKIVYCKSRGVGRKQVKEIHAIPKFYDDLQKERVYKRYDGYMNIQELFNIVFEPTDYDFRLIGSWTSLTIENFGGGDDCLSMFQRVLKRINAEFEFTGKSVTIRERIGRETDIMYRHRLNASNIVHEVDAQDYYTYAKGFGDFDESDEENAKLEREYTSPLAKLLGKRHAPPIKDGRIKYADVMDKGLKELVDNSIKISVIADLVDLHKQNYPYAQSKLGDTVLLIDERIGLDEKVRVVQRSIARNWKGDIIDLKFTFGTDGIVSRYQGKVNNAVNNLSDLLEGKVKLPFPAMSAEIQLVSKMLKSIQTQLTVAEDGSLLAIDKKDTNFVVVFNAAGIGISDDGGQTFKNALTGRGLLADAIMANSITADKLDVNAITVGFNTNSTNLKLYGDKLQFFRDHVLTSQITEDGTEFWWGKKFIGRMGTIRKEDDLSVAGISLGIAEGDFISVDYKENQNEKSYSAMMIFDPFGKFTGFEGIDFALPMRVRTSTGTRYEMDDIVDVADALNGLGRVYIPTYINQNTGAVEKWQEIEL